MERLERLLAIMDRYGFTPDDYDEDVEEDVRPYVDGREPLGRYVCVTNHGDRTYFLSYDELDAAQARAVEYIDDSLFAETPVAVYDLDTGSRSRPVWAALQWSVEEA